MTGMPEAVWEYIARLFAGRGKPAYLRIGGDGAVEEAGGALRVYGLEDLTAGQSVMQAPLLHGLALESEAMPASKDAALDNGTPVRVHAFSAEGARWILLVLDNETAPLEHDGIQDSDLGLLKAGLGQARRPGHVASKGANLLISNTSHELRSPLAGIIGFSELLLEESCGALNDRQRRYVNTILKAGRHLNGVINDILDISRMEGGFMQLDLSVFNLAEALDNLRMVVTPLAERKDIDFTVTVRPGIDKVMADYGKVKQVLLNLLSNAIKFCPEGGQVSLEAGPPPEEILPRIADTMTGKGRLLCIQVRDTGIGIPHGALERIFEEFERVDADYAREQEGTGLGLALTRNMVELHGGRIWAESEGADRGSSFWVLLPVDSEDRRRRPERRNRDRREPQTDRRRP